MSTSGVRWVDIRRELTPKYGVVWRDIVAAYLFLLTGMLIAAAAERAGTPPALFASLCVAFVVWTGCWLHAIFLFGHEAAHRNLAKTTRRNDVLGDRHRVHPAGGGVRAGLLRGR